MSSPSQDWQLTQRQKMLLIYGSAGLAGAYLAYQAYRSDSLAALVELRSRIRKSVDGYSNSLLLASECSSMVMRDVQHFLTTDTDEIPQSLRQLAKLAGSKEVAEGTSLLAAAAVQGAMRAGQGVAIDAEGAASIPSKDFLERIMDLLSTERGSNLVTLAVGMACRSSVQAYCEYGASNSSDPQQPGWWQQLLEFGATPQGEKLYSTCVGTFVREGTKVYMGSMEGVNPWEDFLGSLCKPERHPAVERLTRVFVNELVVSFVKRSRHGATSSLRGSSIARGDTRGSKVAPGKQSLHTASAKHINAQPAETQAGENGFVVTIQPRDALQKRITPEDTPLPEDVSNFSAMTPDWAAALVEAAKHPEIRQLILSVAGTATAEGVRSSFLTARDMLLGPLTRTLPHAPEPQLATFTLQQMSTRNLGTLLLCVFMPIILFLAGRRAALA